MDSTDNRLYEGTLWIVRLDHDGVFVIQEEIYGSTAWIGIESVFSSRELFDDLVRIEIYTHLTSRE